jgi:prolipoprotein diacylglyceryl transferase
MFDTFLQLNIIWAVDPVAFSLGSLEVRWYGILWVTGFFACFYAFRELLKYDNLPDEYAEKALWYMMIGTIVGARVGDCLFYHPLYYLQNPIEILYTWRGGLSSHGGACGILVALYLLSRKTKKPYIWTLDRVVIVIGVMGFCIRMGNLMNSEIYGIETAMPWGFIFERNREVLAKHPTQIYEALFYALTYIVLRFVYRKSDNRPRPFLIFGLFLVMVFGFRFCVEFIKNPQELYEASWFLKMGQLLSLPFLIMGFIALFISRKQAKPEPIVVKTQNKQHIDKQPSNQGHTNHNKKTSKQKDKNKSQK